MEAVRTSALCHLKSNQHHIDHSSPSRSPLLLAEMWVCKVGTQLRLRIRVGSSPLTSWVFLYLQGIFIFLSNSITEVKPVL